MNILLVTMAMSATITGTQVARHSVLLGYENRNYQPIGQYYEFSPQVRIPLTGTMDGNQITVNPFTVALPGQTWTTTMQATRTIPPTPGRTECDASGCVYYPPEPGRDVLQDYQITLAVGDWTHTVDEMVGQIRRYTPDTVLVKFPREGIPHLSGLMTISGPNETVTQQLAGIVSAPYRFLRELPIARDLAGSVTDIFLDGDPLEVLWYGTEPVSVDGVLFRPSNVPEPSALSMVYAAAFIALRYLAARRTSQNPSKAC